MATKYTFSFSDTSKTSFEVFPYTADGPVSPSDNTLIPQAVAQTTTLKIYGKSMQDYGEGVEQDLIYMLENFANSSSPINPIEGQIWYNNSILELSVHNGGTNGDSQDWDAVILATGVSPMTGELILSGIPSSTFAAVPLQMLDGHTGDDTIHLTPAQNQFLDGLDIVVGSPSPLTSSDVNQLKNIEDNVQILLDNKISRSGDTMDSGVSFTIDGFSGGLFLINGSSISFSGGGTVKGVPIPQNDNDAASKGYVDDQVGSLAGADGALTAVDFVLGTTGSPPPFYDPDESTLEFTITFPGSPFTTTLVADGISRVGHFHKAEDVELNNSSIPAYPNELQSAIEYIESNKADISDPTFTNNVNIAGSLTVSNITTSGNVTSSEPFASNHLTTKNYVDSVAGGGTGVTNVSRTFEKIVSIGSPPTISLYKAQSHLAGDNKLSITINGIKYYNNSSGTQGIEYYDFINLTFFPETGLDQSTTYVFAITIDGGTTTIVTIPSGTNTLTHSNLILAINNIMATGSPPLVDAIFATGPNSTTETFTSNSVGSSSSILIAPAAGNYLFATDTSPTAIVGATFLSGTGSPPSIPDDIIITGDVTLSFQPNKMFTIVGSDDAAYGSYDGVYRVHNNDSVYDGGSPGTTTIPIALLADSNLATPLLPGYIPTGSPLPSVPSPSDFGSVHFTPIGGFKGINAGSSGVTGDYAETDASGTLIPSGQTTEYVLFSPGIPDGEKIETILLS